MEDWWGGISCFCGNRRSFMIEVGNKASFRFFLGIDISKEKFDACLMGTNGEKLFQMAAPIDRAGFDELLGRLSSVAGPRESILIGMESTACYHINLFSFLTSRGFPVIIINPLLICNFMKLQLRKTKTRRTQWLSHNSYFSKKTPCLKICFLPIVQTCGTLLGRGKACWIR